MAEKEKTKRTIFRKIINGALTLALISVILLVVFFGFSQTSTFRNYVRDQIVSIVNDEINGTFSIGEIEGTLLTSIILRDTKIYQDSLKLLSLDKAEVVVSPLQLMINKIYLRTLVIDGLDINLNQDSDGVWNYDKLTNPGEETDSTSGDFSYIIQVIDLNLKNISISKKAFGYQDSLYSRRLNPDNLQFNNFGLRAAILADISGNEYLLDLKSLTVSPNFGIFDLKNFSTFIHLTEEFVDIRSLKIETDASNLTLSTHVDGLNLFGDINYFEFDKYPVELKLSANSFDFDDLSSFIGATSILKGKINLDLNASGNFGVLLISDLVLDYSSTHLEANGKLKNLHDPENLFLDVKFKNGFSQLDDAEALLPNLDLPDYDKLKLSSFEGIFRGEPSNFYAEIIANTSKGKIDAKANLNFEAEPIQYDIVADTKDIDLKKFIGIDSRLTSGITLKGTGTTPSDLNSNLTFNTKNSRINGYDLSDLSLKVDLFKNDFDIFLNGSINEAFVASQGRITFQDNNPPKYFLEGNINGLDLAKFNHDSTSATDLNFQYVLNGKDFDLDEITGDYSLLLTTSFIRDQLIEESRLDFKLNKDSTGNRSITVSSDFMDLELDGEFSLKDAIEIISYQSTSIGEIITKKIEELNPLSIIEEESLVVEAEIEIPEYAYDDLNLDYSFEFKNIDLIAQLLDEQFLDISGAGEGSISNDADNFKVSSEINLNYFINRDEDSQFYLSDVLVDINFTRDNNSNSFDNLFGIFSLDGKRFYTGTELSDIEADLIFTESNIYYNASLNVDSLFTTSFDGIIGMKPAEQEIVFENLLLNYKNMNWEIREPVKLFFNSDYLNLTGLKLFNKNSSIEFGGKLQSSGEQDIFIHAQNMRGDIFANYALNDPNSELIADIEFLTTIKGNLSDPLIVGNTSIKDLTISETNLGDLTGDINYSDKTLIVDINFLQNAENLKDTLLNISGSFPIDLRFTDAGERLINDREIQAKMFSNNFDVTVFGNVLPVIKNQKGKLFADVDIKGNYNEIFYDGYLEFKNANFALRSNNLVYSLSTKVLLNRDKLILDQFSMKNAGGSLLTGELKGTGFVELEGFKPQKAELKFTGDIGLLGPSSRTSKSTLFGDLLIGSQDSWDLTYQNNKWNFAGQVLLKNTNVSFIADQNEYSSTNNKITYRIVGDTTKVDKEEKRFQTFLESTTVSGKKSSTNASQIFDYDLGIKIQNIANIQFIFSQLANQRLYVEATGDLNYETVNGQTLAQGEFILLPGSKLEFFKSFDAEGTIRFESNLTDPYLDIVATYQNDYIDPTDPTGVTEPVAIKIVLDSPLSGLGQQLANNPENIQVLKGARNIQDGVVDNRYDAADALSFILVGKFKDDLTASDKTSAAVQTSALSNTATSLLGSVLTNFVNSAVGDVVNNIQLSNSNKSGTERVKFNVSGRIENIRYKIGGTTEVFENIDKADLKLEYIFSPNFLIRLERKDPVIQTYGIEEKISELGLKYKFVF
ncbi:MAG: hypothetical protein K9G34_06055 [Melioribacteraceae bacterium]|nr:hypothetical protein [Melioribacteraceae bacterium]